jgi:alkylation response protein AidB-like acyl-CoA dehydrogenase
MTQIAEPIHAAQLTALFDEIAAGVIRRDEQDEPPYDAIAALKRARLGALRLPVDEGGGGASLTQLFEVFIELAAADSNVAHIVRSHFGIVEDLLRSDRPEDARWRERIAAGDLFGAAATELDAPAGSSDYEYKTAIAQTPDGLRLNGTKWYTTGNLYVDWIVVGATDVTGEKVQVIIPADRPGVSRPNDWRGFGQRFTGSGSNRFENVEIRPEDYHLRGGREALPYPSTFFHIQLNAMIAGVLRRVVRDAVDVVHAKRRPFYHATDPVPTEDPISQYSVGLLASQALAAESLVLTAAAALSRAYAARGTPQEHELALQASLTNAKAKVVIDEIANRAASEIFDLGGASLVDRRLHLDRHWRNIRSIAAHNPKTLKAVAVGRYELNGTPLPNQGFF